MGGVRTVVEDNGCIARAAHSNTGAVLCFFVSKWHAGNEIVLFEQRWRWLKSSIHLLGTVAVDCRI